jgi:hypothetical protein
MVRQLMITTECQQNQRQRHHPRCHASCCNTPSGG